MDMQAIENAVSEALKERRLTVHHREYKTSEDFPTWLRSYIAKCRETYGLKRTPEDETKLKEEIIISIPGKLASGAALNTYERLEDAEQSHYDLLIKRLTEEFSDPQAKRRFNARLNYNTRKEGQSIKEFAEEIKIDMNRYSTLQVTVLNAGRVEIPNPDREQEEVRRFIEGMRDHKGNQDLDFKRHLEYHLQDQTELNWNNAIKVASRYEIVHGAVPAVEEAAAGAEAGAEAGGDANYAINAQEVCETLDSSFKPEKKTTLSALANQVQANQTRIAKIEVMQNKMSAALSANTKKLIEISTKLDFFIAQQSAQGSDTYVDEGTANLEESIPVPVSDLVKLMNMAGIQCPEDFAAAGHAPNFQ